MIAQHPTFTFLFTDIEGSSALWEENPDKMALALARHDTLLIDIFTRHGGHVFKMMGDSVCVAFAESAGALAAAVAVQHALREGEWETARPIRVRAAIHRGIAEQRNSDYFGPTLNRTARLLAAAHGGQTLFSRVAQEGMALPEGVSLRDLGERRLRDLALPERIFQLVAPGLPSDFPPLRSLEVLPNNLPAQVTSFIGREQDIAKIKAILEHSRLVTLTGPGGTGKTRLSVQVAAELLERFIDGVWQVELATVSDSTEVLSMVASALGLREETERTLDETLLDYLRTRKLLLLLDNCEHLVDTCAALAERLLRNAPDLKILASSREALAIGGESTYPVLSLSLPDFFSERWTADSVIARAADFEALRLFVERAAAVQPGFELTRENALTLAKICWRLDGIPLAIELAAARVKMLTPEQIYRRLDDRFRLLSSGGRTVMPRQQTLTALIDWSHELLSEKERVLLRRVSVFGRGRTLKALETVCSGDGIEEWEVMDLLQQLIDKSLLSAEQTDFGSSRYFMLESIWEYARQKLNESGEADRVHGRHLDYFLKMAEELEMKLRGPEQAEWLGKIKAEHINLRMALEWSAKHPHAVQRGLRLAGALWRYWEVHSHFKEGREHYAELLARPEAKEHNAARAKALAGAARLAWCQDDDPIARALMNEAIAIYREVGDIREAMLFQAFLGIVECSDGDYSASRAHLEDVERYARENDDRQILATALSGLGNLANHAGDPARARQLKEESLAAYRQIGDLWVISLLNWSLSNVAMAQRDFESARNILREAATIAEHLGNEWLIPYVLESLGRIALEEGEGVRGARLYGAAEVLRERFGLPIPLSERAAYAKTLQWMHAQTTMDAFDEAWAAGRALAPDEAIRFAFTQNVPKPAKVLKTGQFS
ncbi:MAG: tetratricopeptide repeat protein [Verrucomicrobiota bacterium]